MKRDIYESVTERIVTALEQGVVPWKKPWRSVGFPISLSTKKRYRGINVFLLSMANYSDPRWGTYKAISEAGGQVRKGEKATEVILWKPVTKKAEAGEKPETYRFLRTYSVFNAEQADGLPEFPQEEEREFNTIEAAEKIVGNYAWNSEAMTGASGGPSYSHGGDRAAYSPQLDIIMMPQPKQFISDESYYATFFHELVHSTGHEKRLKRIEPALFGTDPYAREELVAEIGASFLAGVAEFEDAGGEQSAAYIGNWMERIQDDKKLVVNAAAQAQKAVDLILGTTFDPPPEAEAEHPAEAVAA